MIEEPAGAGDFAAEEEVIGDGELLDEIEFLVDDADTGGLGIASILEASELAVKKEFAVVVRNHSGNNFHEGAFSGAIFSDDGMDFCRSN